MLSHLLHSRLRCTRAGVIAGFVLGSATGFAPHAAAQDTGDALDAVVEVSAVVPATPAPPTRWVPRARGPASSSTTAAS